MNLDAIRSVAKRVEVLGRATLIEADCREVLPMLGRVDAIDNSDAVVFSQTHEKPAKRQRTKGGGSSPNLGATQERDGGGLRQRPDVAGADGGTLWGDAGGLPKGACADGSSGEVEGAQGQGERALQGRNAKHGLSANDQQDALQPMWGDGSTGNSSQGRGSHEQHFEQSGGALQPLPHQPPQAGVVGCKKGISLLTDPPYGIDYGKLMRGKGDGHGGLDKNRWKHYEDFDWDADRPSGSLFHSLLSITDDQIIWGGNYFTDLLPPTMQWLVWDKGQRDFSLADCEFAWSSQRKAARIFTYTRPQALQDGRVHPTQKPVQLMKWCLGFLPENSQTILDPFMGSGTTGVAAVQMGRQFIGIELESRYFDIACKRIDEAQRQGDFFIEAVA